MISNSSELLVQLLQSLAYGSVARSYNLGLEISHFTPKYSLSGLDATLFIKNSGLSRIERMEFPT